VGVGVGIGSVPLRFFVGSSLPSGEESGARFLMIESGGVRHAFVGERGVGCAGVGEIVSRSSLGGDMRGFPVDRDSGSANVTGPGGAVVRRTFSPLPVGKGAMPAVDMDAWAGVVGKCSAAGIECSAEAGASAGMGSTK
jgi:hypothetical protein